MWVADVFTRYVVSEMKTKSSCSDSVNYTLAIILSTTGNAVHNFFLFITVPHLFLCI